MRIDNSNGKQQPMILICSKCGKTYKPENGFIWIRVKNNEIHQTCPKCYSDWEKQMQPMEAKTYSVSAGISNISVKFANGTIADNRYTVVGDRIIIDHLELPESAERKLKVLVDKYREEQQKLLISVFKVTDTFDDQYIDLETFGGYKARVRFKYGRNDDIVLEPKILPEYLKPQLETKMKENYK